MNHFQEAYKKLNTKQKEAVDTIYWPVLVIAGPGSGKTQLLAARIANILTETDSLPSNILCLTFTENAAKNMRDRLARMIGPDAYRVAIHTFHSFGNEILNRYKYLFKEYEDSNTIDEILASRILEDILKPLVWDDPYKPGMRASETIRDILKSITNLKKGGVTPILFKIILEVNKRHLESLTPILGEYFKKIDELWQKKEEKDKKISLFEEFTNKVSQMSEIWENQIGWYNSLLKTIQISLTESWEQYDGTSNTKFITTWKDNWTSKNYKWERIWKEYVKIEKQLSLALIYDNYQKMLEERGLIDFSDMILRAIELVERDPNIQANLAEQYQFILIDEYQDTNEAQMRLVKSILSVGLENPNIFAVGDDDQSIYKFQWANIKNIRDFHEAWEDTKLIVLNTNYRSNSEIISTSRSVIKSEMSDIWIIFPWIKKEFESASGTGWITMKKKFQNEFLETTWIVKDIVEKIKNGIPPEEIAVITKKNKSLELIGKWLLEKGISVSMSRTESIWESEIIILIVNIIKYLQSLTTKAETNNILVDIIAHPSWQIPRLEVWKISRDIYNARKDENKSWLYQLSNSEVSEIRDMANFLKELSNKSEYIRLEDLIDFITGANHLSLPEDHNDDGLIDQLQIDMLWWEKKNYTSPLYSYFFDQLSNHNWEINKARYLTNITKFIDHIRSYKNQKPFLLLPDAMEFLSLIETYDIRIETSHIIGNEQKSVSLITVHKAKWLEWDHVYVPSTHKREYKLWKITGSTLPKNLPLEADKDDDADIERLIYTAYTRAKSSLTITYAHIDINERNNDPLPCIEIESSDWKEDWSIEIAEIIHLLENQKKDLFSLPYLGEEHIFLMERVQKNFIMSATALQNFLNIVDAGPEYFISNNILRFPQAKNVAAVYGSAMHKALEDFFTDFKSNKSFKKDMLYPSFEKSFHKEWFSAEIENTWLPRGKENLEELYIEITWKDYGELFLEKDFRTEWGWVFLWDIQITGKIDRIERLSDDTLIITDYKTGSGFDSFDGRGGEYMKLKQWKYRLQLAFYAILFELSPRFRMFPSRQYELFFIEKNRDEERFQRVIEYIHDGEIERTKSLIRAVSACISKLEFPDINKYPKTIEGIRMFEEDLISWEI